VADPNNDIELQLFHLFRLSNALHVRTTSGRYEFERSAYGILVLLDDKGPQRLGAIAANYRLDPSTITRQVQAVVKLGLAAKEPDPADRRASLLTLTPEGREAIQVARDARRQLLDRIMGSWTVQERQEFLRALTRFNETVENWIEGEPPPEPLD
jgi:DNA-binding MarR family transcriptional regulator